MEKEDPFKKLLEVRSRGRFELDQAAFLLGPLPVSGQKCEAKLFSVCLSVRLSVGRVCVCVWPPCF